MRRRLTKLGNKSFVITLPKPWIKKNHLQPKTDLEVTESGSNLVISPSPGNSQKEPYTVYCDNEQEEFLISKIIGLYREGYSEVKLVHVNDNKELLKRVHDFAVNFQGVTVEQKDNAIIMKSSDQGLAKRAEVLNKCFQNLLWLGELIVDETNSPGWRKQIFELYQRVHFLSEYVFRLISIEGCSDIKLTIRQYSMALIFQCLSELLKRIGEAEYDNSIEMFMGPCAQDVSKLIRSMHNVCIMKNQESEFYSAREIITSKITEKKYCVVASEYAFMCQYLCTKLVRMEIL